VGECQVMPRERRRKRVEEIEEAETWHSTCTQGKLASFEKGRRVGQELEEELEEGHAQKKGEDYVWGNQKTIAGGQFLSVI